MPISAGLILIIGTLALIGWALGIDVLRSGFPGLPPMSPGSAVAFILSGLSLWSFAAQRKRMGQAAALAVTLFAAYMLSSEGYGVLSALNFLMFGLALLLLDRRPWPLDLLIVLPAEIALLLAPALVPMALGFLQNAARWFGYFDPGVGGWLFSFANIITLTGVIWWISNLLHRMELRRQLAEQKVLAMNAGLGRRVAGRTAELAQAKEQLRLIIDTALDAVVTIDRRGVVTGWNPHAEAIFGWQAADALGRPRSGRTAATSQPLTGRVTYPLNGATPLKSRS